MFNIFINKKFQKNIITILLSSLLLFLVSTMDSSRLIVYKSNVLSSF